MGRIVMLKRRKAGLFIGLAGVAMLASTITHAAAAQPPTLLIRDNLAGSDATVGLPGVQYPPYEKNSTVEPSIAADPNNPLDAVAAYHSGRDPNGGSAAIGYATTTNGGQTWVHGNLPGLTTLVGGALYNHASDPVVAFGPNHVVYVSSLVITEDSTGAVSQAGLAISTSLDGGTSWEPQPIFMSTNNPSVISDCGQALGSSCLFDDKNWLTVDMSNAVGHHFGRVYVVWDVQFTMLYAYCDPDRAGASPQGCDQLSNWTPAAGNNQGFYVMQPLTGIGAFPVVTQTGGLGVLFNDEGNTPVGLIVNGTRQPGADYEFAQAPGAGAVVWPAPIVFAKTTILVADDSRPVRLQRAGADLPTAGVDPVTGRVAIGWAGGSARTDNLNDPEVQVSTDSTGTQFSSSIRVDSNAPTADFVDRYNTTLAWGADGSLRIAYRQRQENADPNAMSPIIDTIYQVSYDQGGTFSTPLQVDTQNTNVGFCAFSRGGCFEGDYNELAPAGVNTYIVREEAYAPFPGAPPNNTNNTFNNDIGNINQHAWVAVVGPVPSTGTPETPLVATLTLAGAGAVALVVGIRRRHRGELPLDQA